MHIGDGLYTIGPDNHLLADCPGLYCKVPWMGTERFGRNEDTHAGGRYRWYLIDAGVIPGYW